MGEQYERAVSMKELCRAARQCKKGTSWKDGPLEYYLKRVAKCEQLRDELLNGKYKMSPGAKVEIYRPKRRTANAPRVRDRTYQRSMCNNGVYEDLTRSLIYDNMACQKGKGTDLAIRRAIKMLQKLHRSAPGAPIYVAHLDIRKYFPSTPHKLIKELDREKITDKEFIKYLEEIVESTKDERPAEEISQDPFGTRGTGLGSQINQLHQVALLDPLDHELKSFCRYYIRYNDDFLILDHDIEVVKRAKNTINDRLMSMGLTMTDKSGIIDARKNGFYFLRKKFIVTDTGKIVIRLHKKALAEERKTLRGLKRGVDQGARTMEDVKRHYQSWIANAEYAGDAPIREMDRFYTVTFRQKPDYKRKRRYLYGNRKKREGKNQRSRKRECSAEKGTRRGQSDNRIRCHDGGRGAG